MNIGTTALLRGLLLLIAAFNLILGAGLNLSPDFARSVADSYGANVSFQPELLYMVKPMGAFMFVMGALAASAARDPLRYGEIVYGLVLLFVLRGLQRFVFLDEIVAVVGIESSRNVMNGFFFLLLAALLFGLYRQARRHSLSNA